MTTKERILQAAYNCFSQKGYFGTTTREIAQAAGVSEVTLFRLFGSKKELFREVLLNFSVIPDIRSISVPEGSGEKVLEEIGRKIYFSLREKKEFLKILLSEVTGLTEEMQEVYSHFTQTLEQLLQSVFSSALSTPSEELLLKVKIFGSALFGFFISEEVFQGRELPQSEVDEFISTLSRSISGGKR